MRFSIVVPVYNAEAYLPKCIESVLSQTWEDFELVLVDDGSKDSSLLICEKYKEADKRIKIIQKENGGVISARKAGVGAAEGEYLVTIDSDDYVSHNYLEQINCIIEKHRPDVIATGCTRFNETEKKPILNNVPDGIYEGNKLEDIKKRFIYDDTIQRLNYGCLMYSLWSKIVKTDLIKQFQLDVPNQISIGEDLVVSAQVIYHCNKLFVASVVRDYFYCNNPGSMMNNRKNKEYESTQLVTQYLKKVLPGDYKYSTEVYRYLMTVRYFSGLAKNCSSATTFKKSASNIKIEKFNLKCTSIKEFVLKTLLNNNCFYSLFYVLK